jgi:DNA-binding CsgD family transcriptional regulator
VQVDELSRGESGSALMGDWDHFDGDGALLLTEREREVMGLVAAGQSLGSIGGRLALSPGTVRDHARAARAKLGARTLAQATAIAVRDGHIQT